MNNHFCPNPFVYLVNSLDGAVKYCCLVHRGIKDNDGKNFESGKANIDDVWNSNDLNDVRSKMIRGEYIEDCSQCYKLEKMGGGSLRTDLLAYWTHGNGKEKFEKAFNEFQQGQRMSGPVSIEARVGNVCNLKCRMCYPTASVLIEKEFKKLRKLDQKWYSISTDQGSSHIEHNSYFDNVINNLQHIDILRFSGGEPFLNDTTNEIIAKAASSGNAKHIELFVNTNFTRITTELLENLSQFKTVNIDISLDGYKQVHEYIRSGLSWDSIEENIIKIKPYLNKNFYLSTNTTVQNLNVLYLEDVLKWTIGELDIMPVLCVLDNPKWLAVKNMPLDMKQEAKARLNKLIDSELVKNYKVAHWLQGRIQSIIKSIDLPADEREYNRFLYYTQTTDNERGQNLATSVPEVAEYYQKYYPICENLL